MPIVMDRRFNRPMPLYGRAFSGGLLPLDLTPNSDLVIASPFDHTINTTANVQASREYLTINWKFSRIWQTGFVHRVRFYYGAAQTELEIRFWRKNGGGTYDLVGTTGNIASGLATTSINQVDLGTPIAVEVGDFVSIRCNGTGSTTLSLQTGKTGFTTKYISGMAPDPADFDAGTSVANTILPVEIYMQAPAIVHIGDSRVAGHPTHYTQKETATTTNFAPEDTIAQQLLSLNAQATYQNTGIGSQTSANVAARIAADCTALKPKACVIEVGVNDVAGSVAEATYITNMTTILDALVAASVVPIVSLINPWKNGTSGQDATVNSFNAALITLLASYPTARKVDCRLALSNGGDLGDVAAAYNADGVHFSSAGNTVIAQAIEDQAINP